MNCKRRNILAVWRLAYRRKTPDGQRLVKELPEIARLRENKRLPVAWSIEELSKLLMRAQREQGFVGTIPAGKWWTSLLLMLYYTGIRITAALQVCREDVDLSPDGGFILVRAEHQKQKADQTFKVPSDCARAMLDVIGTRRGVIFVWPGYRRRMDVIFRRMIEDAGLQPGDGACGLFHKLRKTSGTHIAAKLGRAAACDHLGHSAMSVTERYLDPRFIQNIRAGDVLPTPILGVQETDAATPTPPINTMPAGGYMVEVPT